MNYFIADIHFGHSNIIKLCNRPFDSVDEMNNTIINNWNNKVNDSDTVYILGDLFYCKKKDKLDYNQILDKLKGKKVLFVGNHDNTWLTNELKHKFVMVTPLLNTYIDNRNITLCHYPLLEWNGSQKIGSKKMGYQIYGHIHNKIKPEYKFLFDKENCLNAGVDINNFEPVTFEELKTNNEKFIKQIVQFC